MPMLNEPEVVRGDSMPSTGRPNSKQVPAPFFDCFILYVIVNDMFQKHERPLSKFTISVRTFEPLNVRAPTLVKFSTSSMV